MEWIEAIGRAIDFIEGHITEDISINEIAASVSISPYYFQKGFSLLCGLTIGEYIRKRRLALAGSELAATDVKIIDLALKYGYDSPDSFAKAFTRFHGVTPVMARRDGVPLKSFAPLKIKLSLEGGYLMDYKIMKKDSFTIVGRSRIFDYEGAYSQVPKFWQEHFAADGGKQICGMYGVSFDADMGGDRFEYLIADGWDPDAEVPQGCVKKVIPEHTWAVFPCTLETLQSINTKIFSEWLPACKDYEIAEGICVEMYSDPAEFPEGTKDKNYYCELWVPIKNK